VTRLLYIANIRLPTEKAHGLQIVQNCEAFTDSGADVTLWTARRTNTAELRGVGDIWAFYGVRRNFELRRIPCFDLLPLVPGRTDTLARLIFYLQEGTFLLVMLLRVLFARADVYYSRDALVILALSFFKPRYKLAYEAHRLSTGRGGRWLQRQTVRRVGTIISVTAQLSQELAKLMPSGSPQKFLVAHDGIRADRFASVLGRDEARGIVGWPQDAFVVGYVGRLHTMAMDKGVGTLVEALHGVDSATLALVGGPDDMAEALRARWLELGLDGRYFLNAGQVAAEKVPLYLSAMDVCVMPMPWTEHFAFYASPMKLFEYMASRRPIVASDLPSTAEVVANEESALLYPVGDVTALGAAIARLRDDPALRERLAANAYEEVMAHYTWAARAQRILARVMRDDPKDG
jgi:glycosyltransferase involved in cell wall biosynthesis